VPSWAIAFVLVALGLWLMMGALGGCLPSFSNPFREETVDRSSPVVLRAIEDLARFQAATGHFEVIVDVEKDTRFVPAAIRGERVLFVAVGEVEAGVDFSNLDEDAVDVSDERRAVELTLPAATFFGARVDPTKSYVYDRDRGLIDRVASLFQDSPTSERELYLLAEQKLRMAAQDDSGLLDRAERNTRQMLTGMLRALGFERVTITFVEPDR
jgi:hypothetical protein